MNRRTLPWRDALFGRFVLVAATSAALVGLAVDHEQLPPTPSWLGVIAVVTMVNFLLSRSWVFA